MTPQHRALLLMVVFSLYGCGEEMIELRYSKEWEDPTKMATDLEIVKKKVRELKTDEFQFRWESETTSRPIGDVHRRTIVIKCSPRLARRIGSGAGALGAALVSFQLVREVSRGTGDQQSFSPVQSGGHKFTDADNRALERASEDKFSPGMDLPKKGK